jgi:hypothetical protein
MYYSRPFQHQERGNTEKRRQEARGKDGGLGAQDEESISGMLTNFSKALGEYTPLFPHPSQYKLTEILLGVDFNASVWRGVDWAVSPTKSNSAIWLITTKSSRSLVYLACKAISGLYSF